jgi:NADH-quinone oxidoreductase subunit J
MNVTFYVAAVVAILATVMVITRLNAVHALLYLIVSLLSVAIIFYTLGASFIAALEVIIYAGAIMVLFVFVVLMLNLVPETRDTERIWLKPEMFIGPCILAAILIVEVAYVLLHAGGAQQGAASVGPKQVGMALFGPYLIGVELASMLLLGAIVGAYHLARPKLEQLETRYVIDSAGTRVAAGGDIVRAGTHRPSGEA